MTPRVRRSVAALAAAAVLILPVPAGARMRPSEGRASATVQRVRMLDDRYRPRSVTIVRGTRVRWRNRGANVHTATATSGAWDSGLVAPGDAWSRVFRRTGTYRYLCTVHPAMAGTITVV